MAAVAGVGFLWMVEAWDFDRTAAIGWELLGSIHELLAHYPGWLFLAMVILPGIGVPVSALVLLAAASYTERFGIVLTCAVTLLAVALNMSWTYWLAGNPGQRLLDRIRHRHAERLKAMASANALHVILLFRIMPGIPFVVQNYLLGFLRVPFGLYLGLSSLLQSLFVAALILSGDALFSGRLHHLFLGLSFLAAAFCLVVLVRHFLGTSQGKVSQAVSAWESQPPHSRQIP